MSRFIEVSSNHFETIALALYQLKCSIESNEPIGLTESQKSKTLKDIHEIQRLIITYDSEN